MTKVPTKITLPAALHQQLTNRDDSLSGKAMWPRGKGYNAYSASRLLGHCAEEAHYLWYHAPYVSPISHHFVYVDADGNFWFRELQLLIPKTRRRKFPCSITMKEAKKRYYRMREKAPDGKHLPYPTSFENEKRVRARWLVSRFGLWNLERNEVNSVLEQTGEKDGHLLNREALFAIAARRRPNTSEVDADGITSKMADIEHETDRPVLRETLVGLEDYAQRKGSAETDSAFDRVEFPVTMPMRNMALSVLLDPRFLDGTDPELDLEWRNQEMARFGGEELEPQRRFETASLDSPPHVIKVGEDEACVAMEALRTQLEALRDAKDDKGQPVTNEPGRETLDRLLGQKVLPGLPVENLPALPYSCFRFVCTWPPLGQVPCVRWKMPQESREGYGRSDRR